MGPMGNGNPVIAAYSRAEPLLGPELPGRRSFAVTAMHVRRLHVNACNTSAGAVLRKRTPHPRGSKALLELLKESGRQADLAKCACIRRTSAAACPHRQEDDAGMVAVRGQCKLLSTLYSASCVHVRLADAACHESTTCLPRRPVKSAQGAEA